MTSAVDVYPNAVLEAMARGVPVVALPCEGGLAELAARGGLLLPDREVGTAADAVGELLASPEARERLRARGYEVAAEHTVDAVLTRLEELYRGALAETSDGMPTGPSVLRA